MQVVSGQLLRQWVGMLVHCYLLARVAGLCPQSAPGLSRPDLLAWFLVRNPTNMFGESPDMLAGFRAQNPNYFGQNPNYVIFRAPNPNYIIFWG